MCAATPTFETDIGDSALGPMVIALQIAQWKPDRLAIAVFVAGGNSSRLEAIAQIARAWSLSTTCVRPVSSSARRSEPHHEAADSECFVPH